MDTPYGDWGFACEAAALRYGHQIPHLPAIEILKLLFPCLGHLHWVEKLTSEVVSERLVIVDLHLQHMSTGTRDVVATCCRWDLLTPLACLQHADKPIFAHTICTELAPESNKDSTTT